jgi:hypothetical protein
MSHEHILLASILSATVACSSDPDMLTDAGTTTSDGGAAAPDTGGPPANFGDAQWIWGSWHCVGTNPSVGTPYEIDLVFEDGAHGSWIVGRLTETITSALDPLELELRLTHEPDRFGQHHLVAVADATTHYALRSHDTWARGELEFTGMAFGLDSKPLAYSWTLARMAGDGFISETSVEVDIGGGTTIVTGHVECSRATE